MDSTAKSVTPPTVNRLIRSSCQAESFSRASDGLSSLDRGGWPHPIQGPMLPAIRQDLPRAMSIPILATLGAETTSTCLEYNNSKSRNMYKKKASFLADFGPNVNFYEKSTNLWLAYENL